MSKSHIEKGYRGNTHKICFVVNGKRRSISVGRTSKKLIRPFQTLIDNLLPYAELGQTPPASLVKQARKLTPKLQDKLVERGLIPLEVSRTINGFCKQFLNDHSKSVKSDTIRKLDNERKRLNKCFGKEKLLSDFTEYDAMQYREFLKLEGSLWTPAGVKKGLSNAAVNRSCGLCSQFFNMAKKQRLIVDNPFDNIEKTNLTNKDRVYHVSVDEFDKLIENVGRWQIRVCLGLARWAGIRLPTEAVRLRWSDVHWGNGTKEDPGHIIVENVKTKHHPTVSEYRKCPIFPELRPYLQEAWEMSKEGAEWVIEGVESFDKNRDKPTKPNLRTTVLKSRKKAGLYPWPDPLKNLRKTRQTELTDEFPQHVVCEWLGNSEKVAEKHYLHVTDEHMSAACGYSTEENVVSNVVLKSAITTHHAPSAATETLENKRFPIIEHHVPSARMSLVGDEGLEPPTSSV